MKAVVSLEEAKRLHRAGMALHWLRPRSKAPVESKWTTGPRLSLSQLTASHKPSYNVGVRLGTPSKIGGRYLAVIDCDVKSTDPKHAEQMIEALGKLFKSKAPTVMSGRGNSSCHFYVLTKEPAQPRRLAQSPEKVRVLMPSVDPTPLERKEISSQDLAKGYRLRAAWEISLMGEGQQVVLPPSIHPDSGKTYEWAPYARFNEAVLRVFKTDAFKKSEKFEAGKFKAVDVDLMDCELSPRVVDMICSGRGVEDRSAALMTACLAMVGVGMEDNAILSVLTDPELFLGQVAYRHRQTKNRANAAQWVAQHTLLKAKKSAGLDRVFEDAAEIDESQIPDEDEPVKGLDPSWKKKIERTQGSKFEDPRPKPTMKNVALILRGEAGPACIKYNEFAGSEFYGCNTPWGGVMGAEVRDIDLILIKSWLANHYRFEPASDRIIEAIAKIGHENKFHPVRDYLRSLRWDGKERINTWLKDYLHAKGPEPYLSAVSRKTLCAMVARVFEPGVKYDHMLVLEGVQGGGKSSAVSILASPWYADGLPNLHDKDAVLAMRSIWVMELGELAAMSSSETEQTKAFISRQSDRIRNPYGKRAEDFPRQCIFIGSTNGDEYLKDQTGNRRFWPVTVGRCDQSRLASDRDQLLAEAVFQFMIAGEALWLDDKRAEAQSKVEQGHRTFEDLWIEKIGRFLRHAPKDFDTHRFYLSDLFSDGSEDPPGGRTAGTRKGTQVPFVGVGPLADVPDSRANQYRAADALRVIGYKKIRARAGNRQTKMWEWGARSTPGVPLEHPVLRTGSKRQNTKD